MNLRFSGHFWVLFDINYIIIKFSLLGWNPSVISLSLTTNIDQNSILYYFPFSWLCGYNEEESFCDSNAASISFILITSPRYIHNRCLFLLIVYCIRCHNLWSAFRLNWPSRNITVCNKWEDIMTSNYNTCRYFIQ